MQIEIRKHTWIIIIFVGLLCLVTLIGCYTSRSGSHTRRTALVEHPVALDKTPPKVLTTIPEEEAVLPYSARPKKILIKFSEYVSPTPPGSVTVLRHKEDIIKGKIELLRSRKEVGFIPEKPLTSGEYSMTIEGFRDPAGNVMNKYEFSFEVLKKPTWALIGKEMQRLENMKRKLNEAIEKKLVDGK